MAQSPTSTTPCSDDQNPTSTRPLSLLVVGGAGYVGSILAPVFEREYQARHLDIKPVPGSEDRTLVGSVNDDDIVSQALEGMEAVVWLAMGRADAGERSENEVEPAFNVNVKGFYRVLRAAIKAKVTRFIYTSSLSVYKRCGDPAIHPLTEQRPADSWAPYGLSKRLAEHMGETAVRDYPWLSFLSLRLMWPRTDADWPGNEYKRGAHWQPLGPGDCRDLYRAAIAHDKPGYHALQCTGDVDGLAFPQTRTMEVIGWRPLGR